MLSIFRTARRRSIHCADRIPNHRRPLLQGELTMQMRYMFFPALAYFVPSIALGQLAALPVGPVNAASSSQTITLGSGVAAALANPVAAFGGVSVTITSDAQLSALSSTYAPQVLRSGFAVLGDS